MSDSMRPPHHTDDQWEDTVHHMAVDIVYPPTPDIAGKVRQRLDRRAIPMLRLAQAALVLLLTLTGLFAVPQVRAEFLRILQIGTIRIIFDKPTAPTLTPNSGLIESVLDLPDETTLAAAREVVTFEILLPAYPPDLGDPDRVFLVESNTTAVALVWINPTDLDSSILALFAFPPDSNVWKSGMTSGYEIHIDGRSALWTDDPHLTEYKFGEQTIRRIVTDPVLIWFAGEITYRLEGALTLEQAIQIMESLQ